MYKLLLLFLFQGVVLASAPVLSSAVVNGQTATLTFNKALRSNNPPSLRAFAFSKNGNYCTTDASGNKVGYPLNMRVSGSTVTFGLRESLGHGTTVKVNYQKRGGGRRDLCVGWELTFSAGNLAGSDGSEVAGFTSSVTNNTPDPGPPPAPPLSFAPTISMSASPSTISVGESSTLSWSTTKALSVEINQGVGSVSTSGTHIVSPTVTTKYIATVRGRGGFRNKGSVIVTVRQPTPPSDPEPEDPSPEAEEEPPMEEIPPPTGGEDGLSNRDEEEEEEILPPPLPPQLSETSNEILCETTFTQRWIPSSDMSAYLMITAVASMENEFNYKVNPEVTLYTLVNQPESLTAEFIVDGSNWKLQVERIGGGDTVIIGGKEYFITHYRTAPANVPILFNPVRLDQGRTLIEVDEWTFRLQNPISHPYLSGKCMNPDYSWNKLIRASEPTFSCPRTPVSPESLSRRRNRLKNRTIDPVIDPSEAQAAVTRRQVDWAV